MAVVVLYWCVDLVVAMRRRDPAFASLVVLCVDKICEKSSLQSVVWCTQRKLPVQSTAKFSAPRNFSTAHPPPLNRWNPKESSFVVSHTSFCFIYSGTGTLVLCYVHPRQYHHKRMLESRTNHTHLERRCWEKSGTFLVCTTRCGKYGGKMALVSLLASEVTRPFQWPLLVLWQWHKQRMKTKIF